MAVPSLVVVFLCVLGAAAVVVVVSAFGRHFWWKEGADDVTRDTNQVSPEQAAYMKRVRELNQMAMFDVVRLERAQARQSGQTGSWGYDESTSYGYSGDPGGRVSSNAHYGHGGPAHGEYNGYAGYAGRASRQSHNYDQYNYSGGNAV